MICGTYEAKLKLTCVSSVGLFMRNQFEYKR